MKFKIFGKNYLVSSKRLAVLIGVVLLTTGLVGGWFYWRAVSNSSDGANNAIGSSAASWGGMGAGMGMWGSRAPGSGFGRPQPVSAGVVRRMDVRHTINALGTMTALNTATVRAKVDAQLKALHFKEGSLVKAGQVLADLDTQNLDVQLTQAQGQLERDTAQYKNALVDQQRYKDLLTKDAIAAQQVDTQDAMVRQLKGTVLIDQGALDSARLQLSYTHVTAPISGRIGLKQVEIGSLVRASDPNGLVTITQFQPIAAVFAVPEKYVPMIQRKLHKGTPLPVEVWDSELSKQLAVGRVSLTDNAIDISTGTLKLKAIFDNKDESLFPNQFTNIKLQLDVFENTLAVPSAAVQRGALGTFVYVINDDSTVTPHVVKLLALDGEWQAVEADLKPGSRVVLDGADRLRAQSKVEVIKTIDTSGVSSTSGASGASGVSSVINSGVIVSDSDNRVGAPKTSQPAQSGQAQHNPSLQLKPSSSDARGESASGPGPGPSPSASSGSGSGDEAEARRARFMQGLPPEVAEKVRAMSPEERKAFFQKMRERRQQSTGE